MSINYKLNAALFLLGFIGVLSLLLAPIPVQIPEEALALFSEGTLKLLLLINPTILLVLSILLGANFTKKIGLDAPIIRSVFEGNPNYQRFVEQLKTGIPIGILAGFAITGFYLICKPYLSPELIALNEQEEIHILTRFFYGGFTEEILVRWGIMSLFIWLGWKLFNKSSSLPSQLVSWVGIILAAILFGMGHLPILYSMIPEVGSFLIFYIVFANMLLGIPAGWLFWKKGLEAAMIAHIFAHVTLLLLGQ